MDVIFVDWVFSVIVCVLILDCADVTWFFVVELAEELFTNVVNEEIINVDDPDTDEVCWLVWTDVTSLLEVEVLFVGTRIVELLASVVKKVDGKEAKFDVFVDVDSFDLVSKLVLWVLVGVKSVKNWVVSEVTWISGLDIVWRVDADKLLKVKGDVWLIPNPLMILDLDEDITFVLLCSVDDSGTKLVAVDVIAAVFVFGLGDVWIFEVFSLEKEVGLINKTVLSVTDCEIVDSEWLVAVFDVNIILVAVSDVLFINCFIEVELTDEDLSMLFIVSVDVLKIGLVWTKNKKYCNINNNLNQTIKYIYLQCWWWNLCQGISILEKQDCLLIGKDYLKVRQSLS